VIKQLIGEVGATENSKGFMVLPDHVRVIQGDGIDHHDVESILTLLEHLKISASNIAFGMGGGLLQKVNRDTFKFAMKANAIMRGGRWIDVVKDPVTDKGKKSKAGVQITLRNELTEEWKTIRKDEYTPMMRNDGWYPRLNPVYRSCFGTTVHNRTNMNEVRARAAL
jgi:nicotinamide phosphoribosyltransferase